MAKGRKKVPTAILEKRGSWRAKRTNEPEYDKEIPEPLGFMDDIAQQEWDRQVEILHKRQLIGKPFDRALWLFCMAYSDYVQHHLILQEEGMMVTEQTKTDTRRKVHPSFKAKDIAFKQMVTIGREFGFTPSSNASIFPSSEKKKEIQGKGVFFDGMSKSDYESTLN